MKYILFDLDGTLMDFHKGEKNAFKDTIAYFLNFIPDDSLCEYFSFRNEELFNSYARGEMKRIEFQEKRFSEIGKYLQRNLDAVLMNSYYIDSLKYQADLYPDVLDILEYLYPKYKLYIASNGMDQVQKKRLFISGIDSYFDDVFISEAAGANKPDFKFFSYVFEKIGDTDLNEYVIIGDRLDTDIKGGLDAGIHAIYLSRDKKEENSIESLKELKKML